VAHDTCFLVERREESGGTMILLLMTASLLQSPTPMRVPDARGGEQPLYRKIQPGEQRDQGLLRRIVCAGRGPIALVVKQKDKVVQYTAPKLSSVDFIVYGTDFRGPVSCEGFGAGLPVYVTWKPEGKAHRAIAVEFLPK
jgi:hypothetical protein